ncbi:hypothetical protein LZ554_008755 [Drepanopeziza brunnea f. sp. 'monogermtubi']|nr:hypothetical protein LZ554_008755 [Drepanopeziza brunnea f. sp. 'monogermtubi']
MAMTFPSVAKHLRRLRSPVTNPTPSSKPEVPLVKSEICLANSKDDQECLEPAREQAVAPEEKERDVPVEEDLMVYEHKGYTESLTFLRPKLGLIAGRSDTYKTDPTIFVGIDLKYRPGVKQDISEVGIAILDSRALKFQRREGRICPPGFPIRAYNFTVADTPNADFVFGKAETISAQELPSLFKKVALGHMAPQPLYMAPKISVVFVGRDITANLARMGRGDPDFWKSESGMSLDVPGVIDLDILTADLGLVPAKLAKHQFRCAGNEANYAIRAMLNYVHYKTDDSDPGVQSMRDSVLKIASEGLPDGIIEVTNLDDGIRSSSEPTERSSESAESFSSMSKTTSEKYSRASDTLGRRFLVKLKGFTGTRKKKQLGRRLSITNFFSEKDCLA